MKPNSAVSLISFFFSPTATLRIVSIFSLPVSFPGFHGFQIKDGGKVKLAFFLHQNTVPRCYALIIIDTCAPGLKINIQLRQTVKGIFNFAAQTSIV